MVELADSDWNSERERGQACSWLAKILFFSESALVRSAFPSLGFMAAYRNDERSAIDFHFLWAHAAMSTIIRPLTKHHLHQLKPYPVLFK